MYVRIAGIVRDSVVDGPGLRFVIFTQGCFHRCKGCHNPDTHDPEGGKLVSTDEIIKLVNKTKLIRGVTFSGGEPFLHAKALAFLAKKFKSHGLSIVTYSGFLFEELLELSKQNLDVQALLHKTDLLIDGPYDWTKRDLRLPFRGSANQRLIDVRESLKMGTAILQKMEEYIKTAR